MRTQELKVSSKEPKRSPSDFRILLQETLVARCKANPAYSLRAFAKQLAIEPSFLSKLLSGKRRVTAKLITKLSLRLGLGPDETKNYVDRTSKKGGVAVNEMNFKDLTVDAFRMVADWYHYAILELVQVEGFENSPIWISKRLGIKKVEAQAAIERLMRLEMLEVNENGQLTSHSGNNTTVGNPFTAVAFRKLQAQILQQALVALETVPMELRDQSSMTMAFDPALIPEAKERIKNFRRELCAFLQQPGRPKTEVYQMSLSLFPVTKKIPTKNQTKENEQ